MEKIIQQLEASIRNNEEIIKQGKYPTEPAERAIINLRKRIALCKASVSGVPIDGTK